MIFEISDIQLLSGLSFDHKHTCLVAETVAHSRQGYAFSNHPTVLRNILHCPGTDFSGIPACFLSEIIAFAENLGRWGLKSEVTSSRAVTRNNYFDSPLRAYPGFVSHWPKRGCDFSMGICAIRKLHLPFASLFSVTLSTTIKSNATVIR